MNTSRHILVMLLLLVAAVPVIAAEEDSIAAIYAFGRTGAKLTTGFAVADGGYVVTSVDSVCENTGGNLSPVPYAIVVSRWTGDACVARVAAFDVPRRLALLKLPAPAFPGVPITDDKALSGARTTSIGDMLGSEEDAGRRFNAEILALKVTHKPDKFGVAGWKSSTACTAEIGSQMWLFLSGVQPQEKVPDSAMVIKRGVGVIGLYSRRIVVTGVQKSVTYYKVMPGKGIQDFLAKTDVPGSQILRPPSPDKQAADAEAGFQAMCRVLSASTSGSSSAPGLAIAAAKLRPRNALPELLLGTALMRAGMPSEALKPIDAALALDPTVPDGNLIRGNAMAALGKPDEAEKSFRLALQSDTKDPRPLIAISDLLTSSDKRLDEAVALAKGAVKLAPDDLAAHLALARALKHSKDYDGATAELLALLKTAPKQPAVHAALGATYEAAGKPDLAEAQYRKLVELQPATADSRLALIDFLISAGRKDDAHREIDAARKLKPRPETEEALRKLEARIP